MRSVYIINRYDEVTKTYRPVMVVDHFDRVARYILIMDGRFAFFAKYPNKDTYTYDEVAYAQGDEGW